MYRCPKHGDDCRITIEGVKVYVELTDDGCDCPGQDYEWDDTNPARCNQGWSGTVGQLVAIEDDE